MGKSRWPNAFFAERGLFTMHEAWIIASQSRWGNHQLESRVGEPHAWFGGRGGHCPFCPLSSDQPTWYLHTHFTYDWLW